MPPDPAIAARLRDHGLRYLSRYPASRARLARVLERRALRQVAAGDLDQADVAPVVAAAVDALAAAGLVDDRVYAEGRARALLRRGRSRARVRQSLGMDGIDRAAAAEALAVAALGVDDGDLDRAAAVRYAKRRGLGPFRAPDQRPARRDRDLRALVRQGFPLAIARAVIDADSDVVLDDPLA